MKDVTAIVLAAGRGTRMKSAKPKVLHEIFGRPMIFYVIDLLKKAGVRRIVTVAGYGHWLLKEYVKGTKVVVQKALLGSGDAVMAAKKALGRARGRDILIICGDTPLIKPDTIRRLIARHASSGASATILTARLKDSGSYGRIVRDGAGNIIKIAEEEEARSFKDAINEINAGAYCFKAEDLFEALSKVRPDNKKKEYYLTDAIGIMRGEARRIESVSSDDVDEIIGINTRVDLAFAARIMKERVMEAVMLEGVTIEDPSSTLIYPGARIGAGSVIRSNTVIESGVEIGRDCEVGPFARIRDEVRIDDGAQIGNFVELVRTRIGRYTKVKHHAYLGDTTAGKNVNVGAGVITANYDGKKKQRTVIEDNAFLGVGAVLIAPVRIGRRAVVGAGCVVPKNHNVPKGATVVGVPARIMKVRKK